MSWYIILFTLRRIIMKNENTNVKRTALVTGASGGLGLSFVNLFAKDGYNLILVARNGNRLEEIKKDIEQKYNVKATVVAVDLCAEDGADKVYSATQEAGIKVDVLVNNAGFGDFGEFYKSDINKQKRMVDLNCIALMHLCHLYIPDMIAQKSGNILNVDSIAAFQAGPLMSVYYATKAFVLSFSQALTRELKVKQIRFIVDRIITMHLTRKFNNYLVEHTCGCLGEKESLVHLELHSRFRVKICRKIRFKKSHCIVAIVIKVVSKTGKREIFTLRIAELACFGRGVYQFATFILHIEKQRIAALACLPRLLGEGNARICRAHVGKICVERNFG
jgi:short-subunit dehydrogenase